MYAHAHLLHAYKCYRFIVSNERIILIWNNVYYYVGKVYVSMNHEMYLNYDDLIGILV